MKTYVLFNRENSGQPHTHYLTGFSGSDSVLILGVSDDLGLVGAHSQRVLFGYLFVDGRYFLQAHKELKAKAKKSLLLNLLDIEIILVTREKPLSVHLPVFFKKRNIKNVTIDSTITFLKDISLLNDNRIGYSDSSGIFTKVREIKTGYEINLIRKSRSIALKAFDSISHLIKPGISEAEIAYRLEFAMKKFGAQAFAFETIVASGAHSAFAHAKTSDKKLHDTDSVIVDFGCVYKGYSCDITHTHLMPRAPSKLKEIYTTVQKALSQTIAIAKEGAQISMLDATARGIVEKAGYGKYFIHGIGHGVGMYVHEYPILSPTSKEILKKGHVITIEPGVYVPSLGGVRIEKMHFI